MKKRVLLLLVAISVSSFMHAQWYFETGVNDAKFTEYVNPKGTKTTLHSYTGLRDMSTSLGYVFPFKSLDERIEENGQPAVFRLAVGLGFDQMNLLTKVDINNMEIPIHYNMAMVQGQLNALFTPSLIRKKQADPMGFHQPAINLLLQGGLKRMLFRNTRKAYIITELYYGTLSVNVQKEHESAFEHQMMVNTNWPLKVNLNTNESNEYVFDHNEVPFAYRIERVYRFNG